jgi:uncharacterized protein
MAGETLDSHAFNGTDEAAVFPGDLPDDPALALDPDSEGLALRFLRFRPPVAERSADGRLRALPHIRLDRALEFLIGDRLR